MKHKKNNDGFSLVELIIVIAIMAVLIGILAPQYLKYVERSRIQKAVTNTKIVADGINVILVDAQAFDTADRDTLLLWASRGDTIDLESPAGALFRQAIDERITGEVKFSVGDGNFPTFTYTSTDGKYCVDYNYTDSTKTYIYETGNFHVYMN